MLGFYDYSVVLTYLSVVFAAVGMFRAGSGDLPGAIVCLMLCGVCDAFDGAVARTKKNRTSDEKAFGVQIDSLSDLIAFGVFPAGVAYFMTGGKILSLIVLVFYILAALIRLAYFNVAEEKRQISEQGKRSYYQGLPVTTIAMILPVYYYLTLETGRNSDLILSVVMLITGVLFLLDVRLPKPGLRAVLIALIVGCALVARMFMLI